MKTYLAILILSGIASFFLTPLARRVAFRWRAVDLPSARKIHTRPMPRLGGLAVYGGFCFPWAGFYFLDNRVTATFQDYEKLFGGLVLGATAMFALGIYDDVKGMKARQKLCLQILIAVGLYLLGFQISSLSNPFGEALKLGWFSAPVTVIWIVGITNAINLLDGIDGLAAGVTACIALALAVINIFLGHIIVALLTLCLAGACLGFLPHNFSPARIFLGDSGSLFIGLVLACIGIISLFKAATASFVMVPLVLFGLPLFDTTSVLLNRIWNGTPLFQADKSHIHHRLLKLGWNQKQAAYFLYVIASGLAALAIFLSFQQTPLMLLMVSSMVLVTTTVIWWSWRIRLRQINKPAG